MAGPSSNGHEAVRPVVGWCTGKDCRDVDGFGGLRRVLDASCDVVELRCLDVCSGAVVVVEPLGADPIVFKKVRSKRMVGHVVDHLVRAEPLPPTTAKQRLTGSKRAKAIRRIDRAK